MQIASLAAIRKELKQMPAEELLEIVNRMARYKKENKELLNYLLFQSSDEEGFIDQVKEEVEEEFQKLNSRNLFWARKGIRRILKLTNKYIRYSGKTTTEIALRAHFCQTLAGSRISFRRSAALSNLYDREVERIVKAIDKLHEDEQLDFRELTADLVNER